MATSNSIFYGLIAATDTPDIGWTVKVRTAPNYERVFAVIDEFTNLTISPELNGVGQGSVTIDADSPFWEVFVDALPAVDQITGKDHLFEAWEDGILRFEFFGTSVQENVLAEDDSRTITISGPGSANMLTWAKVFPYGYPNAPKGVLAATRTWPFTVRTSSMSIWWTLWNEARKRGTIRPVKLAFSAGRDSGGQLWADLNPVFVRQEVEWPEMGTNLLERLNQATGQDTSTYSVIRADWVMWPGFTLDVRPTIGFDRSDKVQFWEGQVQSSDRTRNRAEVANVLCVRDDNNNYTPAVDTSSIKVYSRREHYYQMSIVSNDTQRAAVAQTVLEIMRQERAQWTIRLPYGLADRRPFYDFNLGDWIGVSKFDTTMRTSTVEKYRVRGITIQVSPDGVEMELTLETLLDAKIRDLERKLQKILNTTQPSTLPPDSGQDPDPYSKLYVWDPKTKSWTARPNAAKAVTGVTPTDPGLKVFVQNVDPGAAAKIGDFWYQTA